MDENIKSTNIKHKERTALLTRNTLETRITLSLNIDGWGECNVKNPIGFFNHLLSSFCKHGMFNLTGKIDGDINVDQHHLIEDTGLVIGSLFNLALGDYSGIYRSGFFLYPMDEALLQASVDFGGRSFLVCNSKLDSAPLVSISGNNAASFQTDCFQDFWQAFVSKAECALHLQTLYGRSPHHIMEGLFKAAARALRSACELDERRAGDIPSTKGVIV